MPKDNQQDLFALPRRKKPLDNAERLASLRLVRSENVGPVTYRELVTHFGSASKALAALPDLVRRTGRGRTIRVCPRDRAEAELEAATRCGTRPVFAVEPDYPLALAHGAAPPPMIYVKGRTDILHGNTVAIVGARNCSAAGATLTRMFAGELGKAGFIIVSGLARGIDAAAHDAALATGTVAVVAGGIDIQYPPENAALQARIASDGCIVSELPPGFEPRGQDFPRRNRIIAGLSLAAVIMEAAHRSGSLITARFAAEQGREVMAVPGHPLDPRAEGTNGLIRSGATMVTSAVEIIEMLRPLIQRGRVHESAPPAWDRETGEMNTESSERDAPANSRSDAAIPERVLSALSHAPIGLDSLARAISLPLRDVRIAVMELALAGLVHHHGNQLVSLKS